MSLVFFMFFPPLHLFGLFCMLCCRGFRVGVCVSWFRMHICLHRGFRVVVRVCGGGLSLAPVLLSVVVSSHAVVPVFVLSHVGCRGS